jgi:hypothetical protein
VFESIQRLLAGRFNHASRGFRGTVANRRLRQPRLGVEKLEERALMAGLDDNDQKQEAVELGRLETSLSRSGFRISKNTDVDLFRFEATKEVNNEREWVEIDIDSPKGSKLDAYVRIFNFLGEELSGTGHNSGLGLGEIKAAQNPNDPCLLVQLPRNNTYYIGVSAFPNTQYDIVNGGGDKGSTTDVTGEYSIKVTRRGPDLNDQISEAVYLGAMTRERSGSGQLGSVGQSHKDVDMFRFIVNDGQTIKFDLDRNDGRLNLDSYLRIFDRSGAELNRNDNRAAPGEPKATKESYLEHTFAKGGVYYVGVSAAPNKTYGPLSGDGDVVANTEGKYRLTLTPVVDDDLDDQVGEASRSLQIYAEKVFDRVGETWGWLAHGADVTMQKFVVPEGSSVELRTFVAVPKGDTLNARLRLFDANGREIGKSSAITDTRDVLWGSYDGWNSAPRHWSSYKGSPYVPQVQINQRLAPGTYYIGLSTLGNSGYSAITGKGDTGVGTSGGVYKWWFNLNTHKATTIA